MTSFNRLATANTYDNALRNISQRQSSLSSLQENLTSGKRVVRASDDPSSAAQAERALTRMSRIVTDQRALASQTNSIAMAESTLGDVTNALQSFRELVVSAGNGTFTQKDRQTVALQLQGLRDQIFGLANTKDTNGQPLFSALGSEPEPFVEPVAPALTYTFEGLPGQASSGDLAIPFVLDGDSAFMFDASDGATAGVTSLLQTLDNAITDIGSATTSAAATTAVTTALKDIDIGANRVSAVRGQAGELLNRADRISANQDKRSIQLEADRSRAEDLDMIKGISDFQNQQTGYQAALQSYAQMQKLSLFNYIG
jgi:flagellar hook-associated protein 3 FlgL